MSQLASLVSSRVLSVLLLLAAAVPLQAQQPAAPPDSTLYTNYFGTSAPLTWIVCGSTQQSSGCYASGDLGPFVAIGAMLEGIPSVASDVVTRAIYIVDSGANPVKLYVYSKTDTVSASEDAVSVTLTKTITLPLTGGSNISASMAANNKFLFIGTDEGTLAVKVNKSNLVVTKLEEFSAATLSITSDQYGYVTIAQVGGFTLYGPDGDVEEDGGGSQFMIGTTQAVPASALFGGTPRSAPLLGYKPKSAIKSDSN
ncbi:MAG: hypothetical protein WCA76_08985 [Candidatus Sulfotelmatobacter sp.]|jgi:hypothetical protein